MRIGDLVVEILNRYLDISDDGTAIDAIADVLGEMGYVVIPQDTYERMLEAYWGNKFRELVKEK